jgi:DNA/RNA endonuclease YhcR with UshA esterase domain
MEKRMKLLLVGVLISMFILLLISQKIQPETLPIKEVLNKTIGSQVQVEGNIIKVRSYTNNTFHVLTIKDSTGNITAIFNSKIERRLNINASFNYTISGELQEYNKTLQINAEKIIKNK